MRIVINQDLIKQRARIGQIAGLAGLIILVIGMVLSWSRPELSWIWLITFVLGFGLAQVGIYYGNRYVRQPRPDQILNSALKGLDKRHALYHYAGPVTHLLVGPGGIWALFSKYQRGRITYKRNRWKQSGRNAADSLWLGYMKLFAQESLGRPDLEVQMETSALQRFLEANLPEGMPMPPIQPVLVFTNPSVLLEVNESRFLHFFCCLYLYINFIYLLLLSWLFPKIFPLVWSPQ